MNVGEPTFDTIVVDAQSFVIEAKNVENGRVKIIHRRDLFYGLIAKLIGRSVAVGRFNPSSGKPGGESSRAVIATARPFLKCRHAAKLARENHEGIVKPR